MAPLPPAAGVTRVVLNYLTSGVPTANVFHFTQPGGSMAPSPLDLAGRMANWWAGNIDVLVGTHHALTKVVATDLSPNAAPSIEYTTGLPNAGGKTDQPCSNNVALAISWRTALRGRSFRGRTYHVGICEDQTTGNTMVPSVVTSLRTAYEKLILLTLLGQADFQLVILSYYQDKAVRSVPLATPVTSINVNSTIDTMRRRMV